MIPTMPTRWKYEEDVSAIYLRLKCGGEKLCYARNVSCTMMAHDTDIRIMTDLVLSYLVHCATVTKESAT